MALFEDTKRARIDAPKRHKALRRIRALVVLLVVWCFAAWAAAAFLVAGAGTTTECADAAAVLAGSSAYIERTRLAAEIFRQGRAPRVVLTNDGQRGGWSKEAERNLFFVERAAAELNERGVPAEALEVVPGTVSSTYEEAQRLREFAKSGNLRSLLVVTSSYQLRRARWTFERVFEGSGIKVSFEAAPPGEQTPHTLTWWLHVNGWRMVAGEYVKMIYYLSEHR
jgi:uncharacterized SAM-binding protein YcdF (DUF218 family)